MIKKLYAIYDKKAETELGIFEHPNDLVAIRDFSQACTYKNPQTNEKSQIAKYPEDYCLVCLGTIDTTTMEIISDVKTVAEAKEYAEAE